MMHTRDSSASQASVGLRGVWTVRERDRLTGLVVAQRKIKNVFTYAGLTALASGWTPANTYLAVESYYGTIVNSGGISVGATSVQLTQQVHYATDGQIILSPGLASQEAVGFSAITANGDGTFTYTISACANNHASGDPVCRQVYVTDTMLQVFSEQQYDATNFPNQRMQSPGGYSAGNGNFTVQFYYPGPTLQSYAIICGITDNATIGSGNLLNHFVLGYNHNATTNDLEIDGSITLSNV